MLTYEALMQEAKDRGMPPAKIRGILREYLQVIILKELYKTKSGKKLYFTGGTYLRLVHNLKRFSEDLDFNTENIRQSEFELLIDTVRDELKRRNIDSYIKFKHWENMYAAHLVFPAIEKAYKVISNYSKKEGIVIKIETNRPKWKIKKETEVIFGFGEMYPCICTDKSALFADKIDALGKKLRGRHLYDIIFMLSKGYPIDKGVLSTFGINVNPLDAIIEKLQGLSQLELKRQAEALRPFLFDESEADLLVSARQVIPQLIRKYKAFP